MNVNKSVIENFFLITKKFPSRLALHVDNNDYTYDQLFNSSCKIFYDIKSVSKKDVIAIDFKRSFNQISSILACLIGGNGFVVLDDKMSNDRKHFILKKLKISILITDKKKIDLRLKSLRVVKVLSINTSKKLKINKLSSKQYLKHDNVYFIFTSGSTGEPKGLQITNQNVSNFVNSSSKVFKINQFNKFILLPQLSFDLSVFPLWTALLNGSSIYYPSSIEALYPAEFINKNNINIYCSVPSQINVIDDYLKNSNYQNLSIKKSIFCGEPLYYSQVKIWQKYFPKSKIFNTYGPSEATCFNTFYKVKKNNNANSEMVSIGKPMINNKINLHKGEILISGKQVSPGYIDKILTRQKFFIKNNTSFYQTGDFAKKVNNNYYFLGRRDNQIKLMGHRIELGEIEQKISKIFKNKRVLAFFINNNIYAAVEVKKKVSNYQLITIRKNLPNYMVPKKILNFYKFPYNKNFKIDKKKITDAFKK